MNSYATIARVIEYLDQHHRDQPDLAQLSRHAGMSPYHFHRLFADWAGITPKDFLQCLTLARARQLLRSGANVLDASLESGLSGPGRLHDLSVNLSAASPGEIKAGGAGWTLVAGFADSPFGTCLIAEGPRGICHISFVEKPDVRAAERTILDEWPNAKIRWDNASCRRIARLIFTPPDEWPTGRRLRAFVKGSAFQVRVWRALLNIPHGSLASYGQVADFIGSSSASRSVGTAIAENHLAYLIPCHRVIKNTGVTGQYRWGATRKRAILTWEGACYTK